METSRWAPAAARTGQQREHARLHVAHRLDALRGGVGDERELHVGHVVRGQGAEVELTDEREPRLSGELAGEGVAREEAHGAREAALEDVAVGARVQPVAAGAAGQQVAHGLVVELAAEEFSAQVSALEEVVGEHAAWGVVVGGQLGHALAHVRLIVRWQLLRTGGLQGLGDEGLHVGRQRLRRLVEERVDDGLGLRGALRITRDGAEQRGVHGGATLLGLLELVEQEAPELA